jgi:hypothetical protein
MATAAAASCAPRGARVPKRAPKAAAAVQPWRPDIHRVSYGQLSPPVGITKSASPSPLSSAASLTMQLPRELTVAEAITVALTELA